MVYHLIFSFPKLLFIELHTIISEVCFYNREFHSLIFCVIFGVILCLLGVILGVTLTVILGFTQSLGLHVIELVTINPCLYHLSLTIKICSSII